MINMIQRNQISIVECTLTSTREVVVVIGGIIHPAASTATVHASSPVSIHRPVILLILIIQMLLVLLT